jgi:3-hydroxyacyl-CoA dehydrogenase
MIRHLPRIGQFRIVTTLFKSDGVVMKDLWPELSRATEVPETMKKLMAAGGKGVANANGFYRYTREEAERWERQYREFNYDIRRVARKYPSEGGGRKRRKAGAKSSE